MICAHKKCGREFIPKKPWGKYCKAACGDAARHRRYYRRKKAK